MEFYYGKFADEGSERMASEVLYSLGYEAVVNPKLMSSERLQIILDAKRRLEHLNHGGGDDHPRQ